MTDKSRLINHNETCLCWKCKRKRKPPNIEKKKILSTLIMFSTKVEKVQMDKFRRIIIKKDIKFSTAIREAIDMYIEKYKEKK